MKKNKLTALPDAKIIERKNSLKSIIIGFVLAYSIVILFTTGVIIYFLSHGKSYKISIGLIMPFLLPFTFLPVFVANYSALQKEIKARNLLEK